MQKYNKFLAAVLIPFIIEGAATVGIEIPSEVAQNIVAVALTALGVYAVPNE